MSVLARAGAYFTGPGRAPSILGVTQIIQWGITFYAPTVLAKPITAGTGWSPTLVFGGFSLGLLVAGLLSGTVGRWSDRHSPQRVMGIGSAVSALGLALQGLATHPAVYLLAWLILGLAMRMTLYDAAFAGLARIMGARARRAISELTLWGGFASTVFWPIGYALEQAIGWRGTLLLYAGLALFVTLPLHVFALPAPAADEGPANGAPNPAAASTAPIVPAGDQLVAFVLFAGALALNGFVFSALSAHFVTLLVGLGLAAGAAVTVSATKGPAQVGARVIELFALQRLHPLHLGLITAGLLVVAFLPLWMGNVGFVAALVFALVYGASNGLNTIVRGVLPLMLFGREGYGAMLGRIVAPAFIAQASAPIVFAWVMEAGGSPAALAVGSAAAALSFAAMVALRMRYRA